jgi:hypothetical protein
MSPLVCWNLKCMNICGFIVFFRVNYWVYRNYGQLSYEGLAFACNVV